MGKPSRACTLGSSPRCSTNFFPDHPTVGAPVVTREIQVRVLVGEPIRRDRLTGRTLGSQPNNRSSSLRRGTRNAHVAQLDKAPDYESGRCRFESCRVLQSCEQGSRFGFRLRAICRSDPARTACRGAWPSLPALEAGDRWFKSTHADQFALVAQRMRAAVF